MPSLRECQLEWIEKFDEMWLHDRDRELAGPFLSVGDHLRYRSGSGPILLVGKATDKDWKREEFLSASKWSAPKRVDERRSVTRAHLDSMRERPSSAFWRFWRDLYGIGVPVIWTNLAKIGVVVGNPGHRYLISQVELARKTLREEIAEYHPSIVVITGDYAKCEIVLPVFGERAAWHEPDDHEFCWIDRTPSFPAVLWTDHPERKLKERVQCWFKKASNLARAR
jgi:hypothetical protein